MSQTLSAWNDKFAHECEKIRHRGLYHLKHACQKLLIQLCFQLYSAGGNSDKNPAKCKNWIISNTNEK